MRHQTSLRTIGLLAFTFLTLFYPTQLMNAQSPPSGPAGGDLSGTYPNPVLAADRVRKVGDAMTGALNITLPTPGGALAYPFRLSATGNSGTDRGLAMEFNVPSGGTSLLGGQMKAAWGANSQTYMSFSAYNTGSVAEILRIDGRGRIGIGTTAPATQLHISNPTAAATFLNAGFGGGMVSLQDTNGPVNSKLYQWRSEGGVFRMSLINDAWSGFVQQNLLVANSVGNIGIGTSGPLQKLQIGSNTPVSTTTPDAVSLGGTYSSVAGANPKLRLWDDNGGGVYGLGVSDSQFDFMIPAGKRYVWNVNGVEKMRLDASGNITIAGNINAKYQDVAEWVPASHALPVGTVVTLDPTRSNHVEASSKAYDTRVAGVISEQPGIALGESGDNKVLVATTGRVRIKVDASRGAIKVGDLLVTSDVEGVAMKSQPVNLGGVEIHRPGTIVGKALEPLDKGSGEILVLLSLQ